jgi:hypothetical protein
MDRKANDIPSLPAKRAFVLQLDAEAELPGGRCIGRVEHVVSGKAARFAVLEDLVGFMSEVLQEEKQK